MFPGTARTVAESIWSTGVLLDERVMYTSDTQMDRELLDSFDRAYAPEVIFHDCQFFTGGVHAGLEELETLPLSLKRRIFLVHYGDSWERYEDRVAAAGFAGLAKQHHFYRFD